ncbi:hypothetical protein CPB83DRAFT_840913 [Crepidotus variabilis]|uniref:Uncharacterized protein n=1 Tax=Crepidotus variabilis TaxID=179855 RepID=A0A9P6JI08_9AGAR|nr:hypothetical protein CPB83DRAFT_840913 [Crepidotus variabilis]
MTKKYAYRFYDVKIMRKKIYLVMRTYLFSDIKSSQACDASCRTWLYLYALGANIFFTTFVNAIFVIRIHALYRRSLKVIFVAFTLFKFKDALREQIMVAKQYLVGPSLKTTLSACLIFCTAAIAISFISTILVVNGNPALARSAVPWLIAVYSLAGSHLILDVRKAGLRNPEVTQLTIDVSGSLEFKREIASGQRSSFSTAEHYRALSGTTCNVII